MHAHNSKAAYAPPVSKDAADRAQHPCRCVYGQTLRIKLHIEPSFFVHRVAGISFASWSAQALPAGSSMPKVQYIKGPTSVSSNPVSRLTDSPPHRARGVGGVPDCEATGLQGRAELKQEDTVRERQAAAFCVVERGQVLACRKTCCQLASGGCS